MKRVLLLCALGIMLSGCEVMRDYAAYDYTVVTPYGVDPATLGAVKVCERGINCHWVYPNTPRTDQSRGTAVIIFRP